MKTKGENVRERERLCELVREIHINKERRKGDRKTVMGEEMRETDRQ